MARYYILASMSSVLQHQLKDYLSTKKIIMSLKEMLGEQGRPARQIFMRKLMNIKMAERTPMRKHILKIFDHLKI